MADWSFLTNHARALLCIAENPDARLLDIAASIGVTERTAFGIVTELVNAGYLEKEKAGRRNRYHVQPDMPLKDQIGRERTIGHLLRVLLNEHGDGPLPSVP